MTNKWQCPKCDCKDLDVVVEVNARLIQGACDLFPDNFETDTSDAIESSEFWDENSVMTCRECFAIARSAEFESEYKCRACGRIELDCSRDPCPEVIAEREEA